MKNNKNIYTNFTHLKETIHDLNNILTSTLNSIDYLENIATKETKTLKLIATIKTNFLRTMDIINSLSDNSPKHLSVISLYNLSEDVNSTIQTIIPKETKLKIRFGKKVNNIYGNYSDLYRALLNLIINANEAIKGTGLINISIKNNRKKDAVIISVKDNGIGISSRKIKNIFDAGYSTKKDKSNSGFGLAIVKDIISEHNGTINVHSKYRIGTEFVITIPSLSETKPNHEKKHLHSVLLVDDDQIILELLSELLSSQNYKVTTAKNGKDALNKFTKDKFDLAIIDKTMPIIDGIELIKIIREKNHTIPIILTTGSQEAIDTKYSTLNINAKIKKPWGFEEILNCIKKVEE